MAPMTAKQMMRHVGRMSRDVYVDECVGCDQTAPLDQDGYCARCREDDSLYGCVCGGTRAHHRAGCVYEGQQYEDD